MSHNIKVNDEVFVDGDREYPGTVTAVTEDNVTVTFAKSWNGKVRVEEYDAEDVRVIDKEKDAAFAARVQEKVDEAKNALEAAYEAMQAAKELAEEDSSLYTLSSVDLVDVSGLEAAMEDIGWGSSSLHC